MQIEAPANRSKPPASHPLLPPALHPRTCGDVSRLMAERAEGGALSGASLSSSESASPLCCGMPAKADAVQGRAGSSGQLAQNAVHCLLAACLNTLHAALWHCPALLPSICVELQGFKIPCHSRSCSPASLLPHHAPNICFPPWPLFSPRANCAMRSSGSATAPSIAPPSLSSPLWYSFSSSRKKDGVT